MSVARSISTGLLAVVLAGCSSTSMNGGTGGASGGSGGSSASTGTGGNSGSGGNGGTAGVTSGGSGGSGGGDGSIGGAAGAPLTYRDVVLQDNPIAYFRLGEAAGGIAKDEVTGGPAGTYLLNIQLLGDGAISNDPDHAAIFDPNGSGVSVPSMPDFDGKKAFSLEAWIHPTFDTSSHTIVSKWTIPNTGDENGYILYHHGAALSFTRKLNSTTANYAAYDKLAEGVYTHVVAVYDGAQMALYVNGVQRGIGPGEADIAATPVPLMIGAENGSAYGLPFSGLIDEVAIYDHALDVQRVDVHYNVGTGQPPP